MYMSTAPAEIRFFTMLSPGGTPWGDFATSYLTAFTDAGFVVRVAPLGGLFLQDLPANWRPFLDCFQGDLDDDFINVVCAPPGFAMGAAISVDQLAPKKLAGNWAPETAAQMDGFMARPDSTALKPSGWRRLWARLRKKAAPKEAPAYVALTGLIALHTKNKRNVAITRLNPPPNSEEIIALAKYDLVVVPNEEEAKELRQKGVVATAAPPGEIVSMLKFAEGKR
jgi:hypothetical protein